MSRVMAGSRIGRFRVSSIGEGGEGLSAGGGGSAVSGDRLREAVCVVYTEGQARFERMIGWRYCFWQDPTRWERVKRRQTHPSCKAILSVGYTADLARSGGRLTMERGEE